MKPRNKYEMRVAQLNATLKEDIAVKDMEWYKRVSKAYEFGGSHFCYFTIYTNVAEFEVKRLYRGYKFSDKNTDHFFFVEIIREFNDGERKTYFAKHRQMGGYYDCFTYSSDIELRGVYTNYAGYDISDLFRLSCDSRSQSKGKRIRCEHRDPKELARVICNNPVAETMYKEKNIMFNYLLWRTYTKETCRAYTIAKRHGFVFDKDSIPLWLDMIYAMVKCGKDWHNPVYIAPDDLRATHDRFIRMLIRKQEREEIIRKNRKAEAEIRRAEEEKEKELDYQQMYNKARKRFFDMVLKKGSLSVRVLTNIGEFKKMAEYFHNCVFANGYWNMKNHPKSLIMVACIGGNKAELMEIDLENYTIKQCFGRCNQFTNYHDKIVKFVSKQMDTIREYNQNKKQVKKAA